MFTFCLRVMLFSVLTVAAVQVDVPFVVLIIFPIMPILGSFLFCCSACVIVVLASIVYFPYFTSFLPILIFLFLLALAFHVKGALRSNEYYMCYIERYGNITRSVYFLLYFGLGIYALRKDTDVLLCFVLLSILLIFHLQYRFLWFRMSITRFAELGMLSIFLLLSVIVIEVGARIIFRSPPGNHDFLMPHPHYIFMLNPGGTTTYPVYVAENTFPDLTIKVSSQGFRDQVFPEKEPGEYRVLLLGDSFTMGSAVRAEDTISSYLEKILRNSMKSDCFTVINGGTNGAGPLQSLGMLKERGLPLKPDMVIMELFLFNDFDDCLMPIGKAQRNFYAPFRKQVAIFMRQNTFPYWLEYNMILHSSAYRQLLSLQSLSRPWIGDVLSSSWLFHKSKCVPSFPAEPNVPSWIDINRDEWYPELNEGMSMIVSYVSEMHTICADNNIGFAVYCVPDYHEVNTNMWNTGIEPFKDKFDVVRYKAMHTVEKHLREKGIAVFTVLEALQENQNNIEDIYYIYDGHTSPKGNIVIAQKICDYLIEAETFPNIAAYSEMSSSLNQDQGEH